ncbi:hypothetical protein ABKY54_004166 [Vibrio harveyi]
MSGNFFKMVKRARGNFFAFGLQPPKPSGNQITVTDADVIAAVTYKGTNGSATGKLDTTAIAHAKLSFVGNYGGLSNGSKIKVKVKAESGFTIVGHGSEFVVTITVSGLPDAPKPIEITVSYKDVESAVQIIGFDGDAHATIPDLHAIDHVRLGFAGKISGLSNNDKIRVTIKPDKGYKANGHVGEFAFQITISGLPSKVAGFAFTLMPEGDATSPKIGLDHSGIRKQGFISPDSWHGLSTKIALLSVNKSNNNLILKAADGSKWDNADALNITFDGFASPVKVTWSASSDWYYKTSQKNLYDFLLQAAVSKKPIGINIAKA